MGPRRVIAAAVVPALLALLLSACGSGGGGPSAAPMRVGLLYPTAGAQGVSGTEEERGALMAAEWANQHGGINGHHLTLETTPVDRPEAVPGAMAAFARAGVSVIVGSHGSLYSAVAATEATRNGQLLWETGAVGQTDGGVHGGANFVRMAPMGANLGRDGVEFVNTVLTPKLAPHGRALKWAITYVDDAYGRAVGLGARAAVVATGQPDVATFPYQATGTDYQALAKRIGAAHPDLLFVSAYLDDGIALRRAMVAAHIALVASIGTSSSYCMPAFGAALGADGVGLFASDKPDAAAVRSDALSPEGRAALAWAAPLYKHRYGGAMSSHALSGFANAFALFVDVLPAAGRADPVAVAAAALSIKLPVGTLANGGGLDIAPPGAADAGNNRNAAGVIWEWVGPGQRAVVWPPPFATHAVVALPLSA
jgi:ABC-type branched-subunit amino acid transport system substrate-binding protein